MEMVLSFEQLLLVMARNRHQPDKIVITGLIFMSRLRAIHVLAITHHPVFSPNDVYDLRIIRVTRTWDKLSSVLFTFMVAFLKRAKNHASDCKGEMYNFFPRSRAAFPT
jgi:hypothetical protein